MSASGLANGGSGEVTPPPGLDGTEEDGKLRGGADPLPKQLQLALHLIETTLGSRQLGTQLLGLAPQRPGPSAEVEASHQDQTHPDQQPPPHEAGPYPFAGVDPEVLADLAELVEGA
jgi:hypothetical protein